MASIGFTGDVMLGRLVDAAQQRRPVEHVWGDLLERLQALECLCVNLECCLSTRGSPWRRTHRRFHFRADPDWAIPALQRAGVDCCALANNHVLDFGGTALEDTLRELDDAGIARAGAGRDLGAALEPAFVTASDLTVAVVSFTDNVPEYGADDTEPGTAYIEIEVENERTRERVETALERADRRNPDLVIGSLHWGPNMVEQPPAAFREFARWLVDRGVDIVHGHSAHVFHGVEVYEGSPILYDTGDFVDDYAVDDRLRNDRSFLFECSVDDDGRPVELRLLPTEIDDRAVRLARPDAAEWSRRRMVRLSREFMTTFDRDGEELVLSLAE